MVMGLTSGAFEMGSEDIDFPGPDYQTLAEKSMAGLYVLKEGRLSYVNERLCRTLGYESREELIGKSFGELIHPDDRNLFDGENTGQKGLNTPCRRIARVCRKDGSVIWALLEESAAPYQGRSADMGCLIDFTPFKQAEASLRQSLER